MLRPHSQSPAVRSPGGSRGAAPALRYRTGVEIELLAPAGSDRLALASEIARRCGGQVNRAFHTDSEPSSVPGMGVFLHVTPAFEVHDAAGRPVCSLVDDITITADLDHGAAAPPGWYRLLTDDHRLLGLLTRHSDPAAPLETVLQPVAELFGVPVEVVGGAARVRDRHGLTVALAAPLPGQRERPCEIVTPPLTEGHEHALEALLAPAPELGFTVPREAAVHLHLDAAPFRSVEPFRNLVRLFGRWRPALRAALGTNPACRRLQPLPQALLDLVEQPWSGARDWRTLQAAAGTTGLTKFYDINLTQLLTEQPLRDTIEVRILPGALHARQITTRAALVEALLDRCLDQRPLPGPTTDRPTAMLQQLHALAGA